MQIGPRLHLLLGSSGKLVPSDPLDCCVFAVETSAGTIIFDAGAGRRPLEFKSRLAALPQPSICFVTHAHADHSAGLTILADLGVPILAGGATSRIVELGDERAMSLDRAKAAGIYPTDFVVTPCPVQRIVQDGETVRVGDTSVRAIATPGHSADHISYLVESPTLRTLISGDALFEGGRVVLQDTWDCSVADTCETIRKLAREDFDAFLPGHGAFAISNGRQNVEIALARLQRLLTPELFI